MFYENKSNTFFNYFNESEIYMKDEMINIENLEIYCEKLNQVLTMYQSNIDLIKKNIAKECKNYSADRSYGCGDIFDAIREYTIEKEFRKHRKVLNQQIQMLIDDYQ